MIAESLFNQIAGYMKEAVRTQSSSLLVDQVNALNLNTEGEVNYMNLKCSYMAKDGSSIEFSFRSYDPSGPFKNLPDVNKIHLQLLKNGDVVSQVSERFDDNSIYGA
ncbi:hypothetical protein [Halomonas salipaludis]|uniref:hypothetical protein n=1 Tax=Halomonas salipaludis TaxID=2032625 RepID=UPI001140CDAC|nr:hypothetical protein [Halomonas salipaludis]